jgi:hypothetical protein
MARRLKNSRHRSMVFVLLVLATTGCGGSSETTERPEVSGPARSSELAGLADGATIGVSISATERDLPGLFEEWRALGVNTVFAKEGAASSGGFRALAKKSDLGVFIRFPAFLAPEELAENPGLWAMTAGGKQAKEDGVGFACPSRTEFRSRRVENARTVVKRLRPDGISIDFIRYPVFGEGEGTDDDSASPLDTCYCVYCLQAFATSLGVPTFTIPPQPERAAAWIKANAADTWVLFKAQTITSMAEEIAEGVREIDPDILINIDILPWRDDEHDGKIARFAGQDPAVLGGIADFLSPTVHLRMRRRPPEWIASVIEDIDQAANCPVVPSIRVSLGSVVFSEAEFEATLRAATEPPSAGVIFQLWDDVDVDPERAEIIRCVILDR